MNKNNLLNVVFLLVKKENEAVGPEKRLAWFNDVLKLGKSDRFDGIPIVNRETISAHEDDISICTFHDMNHMTFEQAILLCEICKRNAVKAARSNPCPRPQIAFAILKKRCNLHLQQAILHGIMLVAVFLCPCHPKKVQEKKQSQKSGPSPHHHMAGLMQAKLWIKAYCITNARIFLLGGLREGYLQQCQRMAYLICG